MKTNLTTKVAYDQWATQYDTNENKTRDLEGLALRMTLATVAFSNCLEIGCGTGKNTEWLVTKANRITCVDLSEEMLMRAKEKVVSETVEFIQADIASKWTFANKLYDLIVFSLVLEHIQDLGHVFSEAASKLQTGGYVYIGELHPFKQYSGSKARFETENGTQVVECFNHNISDFIQTAKQNELAIVDLDEYFDNDNRNEIPRILTLVLKKM